ncbi:glycosyl hydrolase family 32 [Arthrobacter sp. TMS1-12-1]
MSFTLTDHWVWDFWHAADGDTHHLFYLHAPKSLRDPELRHRNARIGHATSTDLHHWEDHGEVLRPGAPDDFDGTATWTGSVVRADNGLWNMFYTGSRFLSPHTMTNVETVGRAVSHDLTTWTKYPLEISADPRWYETLSDRTWHEEAWRDPWIHRDDQGLWHMLITARASTGTSRDRGVIGHATSDDLEHWTVQPALSTPGAGFAHLEVLQLVTIDSTPVLIFSCDTEHLAGEREESGSSGGIWAVALNSNALHEPIDLSSATRLTDEDLYAGRAIRTRTGQWVLLAFENTHSAGTFVSGISDPMPLHWSPKENLVLSKTLTTVGAEP